MQIVLVLVPVGFAYACMSLADASSIDKANPLSNLLPPRGCQPGGKIQERQRKCWERFVEKVPRFTGYLRYYISWIVGLAPQDVVGNTIPQTGGDCKMGPRGEGRVPEILTLECKRASPPLHTKGGEKGCDSPLRAESDYFGALRTWQVAIVTPNSGRAATKKANSGWKFLLHATGLYWLGPIGLVTCSQTSRQRNPYPCRST
jgi:hypothetical protein